MTGLELVLFLVAVSAALQILARRWRLPHPVLLVLGGAALALVPGLPRITLDPAVVFLLFVPPLLYWTAFNTSFRDFRAELWPIVRLGVFLVLVSIGAVAWVAHALTPEFTWPAAFALAAIVSPPDPVAATAVMRPFGAPSTLIGILEGEGLVNDATALVAYRVAVAAAVTGSFSPVRAGAELLVTGAGGVVVGLAVGWAIVWVRRHVRGLPTVQNTVSLLSPFAAYLPANRLGASGILAVVTVGLYVGRNGPRIIPAATRVQAEAMWAMIVFLLESLVFILIGLELPYAVRALHRHSLGTLLWYGVAISGVLIAVRMLWVFPSAYLPRLLTRAKRADGTRERLIPSWRQVAFVGWAGMRGGDSLVIALALPFATAAGTRFPARGLIIFVTFAVIFATLVLQGLSLGPLLRLLRLGGDGRAGTEEAHARRVAAEAGLRRLVEVASGDDGHPEVARHLRRTHRQKARRWTARDRARHGVADEAHRALEAVDGDGAERESASYRTLRGEMIAAERDAVVDLRDRGVIGDDVMRRVQRDLDLETMLLEADADGAPESPYTP
jgi:CPA1 family monovalent cation:H+ antiporter